jgi:uncharacterized protein YsxB (DUF464 family)
LITVTFHNLSYDEELRLPDSKKRDVSVAVEGHAIPGGSLGDKDFFAETGGARGENIICAAVSFAGLNLIRSLRIIAGISPEYTIENGLMKLSVALEGIDEGTTSVIRILLESFIIGMLDLQRKYADIISVVFK